MATNESDLTFTPLHHTFGAECHGVDFSQPVSTDTITQIRTAMAKYGVLVFRDTALDDVRHTAFARQFGELDVSTVMRTPGVPYRLGPVSQLTDVANVDHRGNVESTTSLRSQAFRGNGLFHVDCSFHHRRAGYSLLRAHQLPPSGSAGATVFADTRTAYVDLNEAMKSQIHDYVLWHSILHSRILAVPDNRIFKIIDWALDLHDLRRLSHLMSLVGYHLSSPRRKTQRKSVADNLLFSSIDSPYALAGILGSPGGHYSDFNVLVLPATSPSVVPGTRSFGRACVSSAGAITQAQQPHEPVHCGTCISHRRVDQVS